MFSPIKVVGFLLAVFVQVHLGAFESGGRINNVEAIHSLNHNLLTNPGATVQAYYDKAQLFADKSGLRHHILTAQRAFNLSLIDVRLVLEQTQEHFKIIYEEHAKKTSPLLKTPLIVMMDSFLQATYELNDFVSSANETINNALLVSDAATSRAIAKAFHSMVAIHNCSSAHHVDSDVNFAEEMEISISKVFVGYTVQFNEFVDHLSSFKGYFPDAVAGVGDCLLVNEPVASIRQVLDVSKCLGLFQDKRFTEFYTILNKGTVQMNNLIASTFRLASLVSVSRTVAEESFHNFNLKHNISC